MAYDSDQARHQRDLNDRRIEYRREKDARDREQKDSQFQRRLEIAQRANETKQEMIQQKWAALEQKTEDRKRLEESKAYIAELQAQQQPELMRLGHELQLKIMEQEELNFANRENIYEQGRRFEFERDRKRLVLLHDHAKELALMAARTDVDIVRTRAELEDAESARVRVHELELKKISSAQELELEYQKHLYALELAHEQSAVRQDEMRVQFELDERSLKARHAQERIAKHEFAMIEVATARELAKIEMVKAAFDGELGKDDREHETDEEHRKAKGMADIRHYERQLISGLNPKDDPIEISAPERKSDNEEDDPLGN